MRVSNHACLRRPMLFLAPVLAPFWGVALLAGCMADNPSPVSNNAPAMRASQDAPGQVLARNELMAQWTVVPSLRPSGIGDDALAPPRFLRPPMPAAELVHEFATPPGSETPMPINLMRITLAPVSQNGWSTVPSISAHIVLQQAATTSTVGSSVATIGTWTPAPSVSTGAR